MKTLVIGASENTDRYSNKAIKSLVANNHDVVAIGLRKGIVTGIKFDSEKKLFDKVDTVTLYIGPQNQPEYFDYILNLKPRRVIFNPGTENPELISLLKEKGILPEIACTLVLLATGQY